MKKLDVEFFVGLFIVVGIVSLGYLSIKLGKMEILGTRGYSVIADFPNIGGLNVGAQVEIAGVEVGRVKNITLVNYKARVSLDIDSKVELQEDAIASIKTKGLLGEKYISILPGASDTIIPPNGKLRETYPPVDLEDIISKIAFGKVDEK